MTIHESEEDDFRSEFHGNRNRKGFKDTKWKNNYYGMVRTKSLIIYCEIFPCRSDSSTGQIVKCQRLEYWISQVKLKALFYRFVREITRFSA